MRNNRRWLRWILGLSWNSRTLPREREVTPDLKNPDSRHKRKIAVVRQINRTIRDQRRGEMDGVRSLNVIRGAQLSSRAQDSAGDLLAAKAPTSREKGFVLLGERSISSAIWLYEGLQKREGRGYTCKLAIRNGGENRLHNR